nr:MAG TPA: hypothetical protein [Caudoviricetes sp.]
MSYRWSIKGFDASLITAEGIRKISVKTGTTGTHGAKGCPVSVTRNRPGRGCI